MVVSGSGRPFRFLGTLIALWIGMRIVQLWPVDGTLAVAEVLAPPAAIEMGMVAADPGTAPNAVRADIDATDVTPGRRKASTEGVRWLRTARGNERQPQAVVVAGAMLAPVVTNPAGAAGQSTAGDVASLAGAAPVGIAGAPLSGSNGESRLRGSGWLIVRGGQAAPFVPQLGGSQAGARLTYAVLPEARLALAGRFSTALRSRQREAAIGLDWQPTRLPVHVVAEQRIGIEEARGGPSLALIGGFGPTPLAAGLALDGYGQAGVIVRDTAEGFADGAMRVSRVVATAGEARLELGLGAWGGAQRGAARLDAGPSASAVVPLGGAVVRLSVEWRARLAGRAAPSSGPAVSIGTDF